MEGTVIDLGDDLVAKIWHTRTAGELEVLRSFYEAVAGAVLPFQTPRIRSVLGFEGRSATVEDRLTGRPLRPAPDTGTKPGVISDDEAACVADVLTSLAGVGVTAEMGVLPPLEGEPPFPTETTPFTHSLADLVERRVAKFRGPLLARCHALDHVAEAVVGRLRALKPGTSGLVHGDLVPANILVDDAARPLAVLDFGFLTTIGDPAFDAAVTASIYDMYGPNAAGAEAVLEASIADRFGYEPERLSLYRAAYALVTSNVFSASGSDGHFEWCMRMLERPRVLGTLAR